jgi:hypothetical protein
VGARRAKKRIAERYHNIKRLSPGWRQAKGFRFEPASKDLSVRMAVAPNAFCVRTHIARVCIY